MSALRPAGTTHRAVLGMSAVALATALAGCGGSSTDPAPGGASTSSATSSASPPSSAAGGDVAFAQKMLPHHEQAIEMAELALADGAGASAEVKDLAEQVIQAQEAELTTMTGWLSEWGAPTAPPVDPDMEGMMGQAEMSALGEATGTAFDTMWLTMMIAHHESAVSMAKAVLDTTSDPRVTDLAESVVTEQQQEIESMTALLPSS